MLCLDFTAVTAQIRYDGTTQVLREHVWAQGARRKPGAGSRGARGGARCTAGSPHTEGPLHAGLPDMDACLYEEISFPWGRSSSGWGLSPQDVGGSIPTSTPPGKCLTRGQPHRWCATWLLTKCDREPKHRPVNINHTVTWDKYINSYKSQHWLTEVSSVAFSQCPPFLQKSQNILTVSYSVSHYSWT